MEGQGSSSSSSFNSEGWSEICSRVPSPKSNLGVHSTRSRSDAVAPTTSTRLLSKRSQDKPAYKSKRKQSNQDIRGQSGSSYRRPSSNKYASSRHGSRQNSVMMVKARGYSISRTPSTVEMNINTTAFFESTDEVESWLCGPSRKSSPVPERPRSGTGRALETMTEQLEKMNLLQLEVQTEIAEKKLELERGREERKEEVEKMEKKFEEEKEASQLKHEQELSDCVKKYEDERCVLQGSHATMLQDLKDLHDREKADLQAEIKVANEAHITAMAALHTEHAKTTARLQEKLQKEHEGEKEQLESVLRKDSSERVKKVREDMSKEHKKTLERLKELHQREMENLLIEFSKLQQLEEELAKSKKHAKKLEKQVSRLKAEVKSTHSEQLGTQATLMQTQTELEQFKTDFQRKIQETQAKTRDRLDDLLMENCQLRKKFLSKTMEFAQYQADVESMRAKTILSYKEKVHVMIKARTRANLSVALGITEEASPTTRVPRPSSAPVTRTESSRARTRIQSTEPNKESTEVTTTPPRPRSCLANFDQRHH